MTHLKIQQNNGAVEEVSSTVISKLYDIVRSNTLDSTSDLVGRLHTSATFLSYITYLTDRFNELYIDANKIYIDFEDPEVARILATKWGDGVGLTQLDLVGKTSIPLNGFFNRNTTITSFNELNDFTGITGFYTWAFEGCNNLTSIGLDNILYAGGETFSGCPLTGIINLPSVIDIGDSNRGGTFLSCNNITQVNCGPNLNGVGDKSFSNCTSLLSVTGFSNMNKSVSNANESAVNTIPSELFYHCSALESTDIDYSYIETINYGAFQNCSELEDTIDLSNIINIWSNAFYSCSKINFTGSTVNLAGRGLGAFYGCDLSNVTVTLNCNCTGGNYKECFCQTKLPSNITFGTGFNTINSKEFYLTTGLKTITGGANITGEIASSAFQGSSIESVTFDNVTSLGGNAFESCKSLVSASFPSLITTVSQSLFKNCTALTTFTAGSSFSIVGLHTFSNCTALTIFSPFNTITSIGLYGFNQCPLTSSTVNLDSLTDINGFAFAESGLTSVSAPLLTEIAGNSFKNCKSLTTANFPSATTINGEAFRGCSSLSSFTGFNTVETIGGSAFLDCSSLAGSISLPNCTSIGSLAFSKTKLTSITTNSITTTTYLMFSGISTLLSLTMNGLTTIPSGTSFLANSFTSLTHLSFPDLVSAASFGTHASDISIVIDPMPDIEVFKNHLDFKKLDLGPNLTTLGEGSPSYWNGVTIIRATTVPTLSSGNLNSPIAGRIYVPDAALSDYRTAWSGTASKIFPISLFATDYPNDIT